MLQGEKSHRRGEDMSRDLKVVKELVPMFPSFLHEGSYYTAFIRSNWPPTPPVEPGNLCRSVTHGHPLT